MSMKIKTVKLLIVLTFAFVAIGIVFTSVEKSRAQKDKTSILELAASYKTWTQPVKPLESKVRPPKLLASVTIDPISIADSTGFG